MKSLVALLDRTAPSFCYYDPAPAREAGLMDLAVFEQVVDYALRCHLALQIIAGADGVPESFRSRLPGEGAVCYAPAAACAEATDVPVINACAPQQINDLKAGRHGIAMLRVGADDLPSFPLIARRLAARVNRVVVVLVGVDRYDDQVLADYDVALGTARQDLQRAYLAGDQIEVSVLSDRLALRARNDCRAGLDHVTVDPSGALHICPGFAVDDAAPVGRVGEEPVIPNRHLLTVAHAPICGVCDAFHCRRCVYMNQRATLEICTPASQVCRAAHMEREASRMLLAALHARKALTHLRPIPPIDYDDPLERLVAGKEGRASKASQGSSTSQAERPKGGEPLPTASPAGTSEMRGDQVVGQLTEAERDEIRALHVRKRGLEELFKTLAKMDDETLESTPLYDRIVRDMGDVTLRFTDWWDEMAKKYRWPGHCWSVDFGTRKVRRDCRAQAGHDEGEP